MGDFRGFFAGELFCKKSSPAPLQKNFRQVFWRGSFPRSGFLGRGCFFSLCFAVPWAGGSHRPPKSHLGTGSAVIGCFPCVKPPLMGKWDFSLYGASLPTVRSLGTKVFLASASVSGVETAKLVTEKRSPTANVRCGAFRFAL